MLNEQIFLLVFFFMSVLFLLICYYALMCLFYFFKFAFMYSLWLLCHYVYTITVYSITAQYGQFETDNFKCFHLCNIIPATVDLAK